MQNFSFNIKQSATIKPVEEVSKSAVNTNISNQNPANTEGKSAEQNSFQSLLNKQVQAKRTQENAVASKPNNKPIAKNVDNKQKENTATQASNETEKNGVEIEKKPMDEDVKAIQESLLNQLNTLPNEKPALLKTIQNDDDKRKITEDAAILASIMQDANNAPAQVMIDPATLKMNMHGALNREISLQKQSGNVSSSIEMLTKDGLVKSLPTGLIDQKANQALDNTFETHEGASSDQQTWKDVLSTKTQVFETKPEQSQLTSINTSKEQSLNAQVLNTLNNKESLIKDNENHELSSINSVQNYQQVNSSVNNLNVAASQLGSSNHIMTPFGKSGWDQAISQKVMWMVGSGEQTATLTLNPPDLGPLQVVISVNNDQADTTFISDNADVRQALQDGLDHLREKMEASGIQLGQANINAGQQSQQAFQESARQQSSSQNKTQSPSNVSESTTQIIRRETNGLVDTFA